MDEIAALVTASLLAHSVEHELMRCDPSLADTARFCEHYGVAQEDSANAILVAGKAEPRKYAVCVLLATDATGRQPRVLRCHGREASLVCDGPTRRRKSRG
jgi:hypothetical protein